MKSEEVESLTVLCYNVTNTEDRLVIPLKADEYAMESEPKFPVSNLRQAIGTDWSPDKLHLIKICKHNTEEPMTGCLTKYIADGEKHVVRCSFDTRKPKTVLSEKATSGPPQYISNLIIPVPTPTHFFCKYFNYSDGRPSSFPQYHGDTVLQATTTTSFKIPNTHKVSESTVDALIELCESKGFIPLDEPFVGPTDYACAHSDGDDVCCTFPLQRFAQYADPLGSKFLWIIPSSDEEESVSQNLLNFHLWHAAAAYVGYVLLQYQHRPASGRAPLWTIQECIQAHHADATTRAVAKEQQASSHLDKSVATWNDTVTPHPVELFIMCPKMTPESDDGMQQRPSGHRDNSDCSYDLFSASVDYKEENAAFVANWTGCNDELPTVGDGNYSEILDPVGGSTEASSMTELEEFGDSAADPSDSGDQTTQQALCLSSQYVSYILSQFEDRMVTRLMLSGPRPSPELKTWILIEQSRCAEYLLSHCVGDTSEVAAQANAFCKE